MQREWLNEMEETDLFIIAVIQNLCIASSCLLPIRGWPFMMCGTHLVGLFGCLLHLQAGLMDVMPHASCTSFQDAVLSSRISQSPLISTISCVQAGNRAHLVSGDVIF